MVCPSPVIFFLKKITERMDEKDGTDQTYETKDKRYLYLRGKYTFDYGITRGIIKMDDVYIRGKQRGICIENTPHMTESILSYGVYFIF